MSIAHQLCAHRPFLLAFAHKLTTNRADADDLAQETLQKAIEHQSQFHGTDQEEMRAWLSVILRNLHFGQWRHKKLIAKTEHLWSVEEHPWRLSGEGLVHLEEVSAAIQNLSPRLRAPMNELLCGLEYEEVAEQLDVPVGTVKSRLFRARERLTAELERQ